MARLVRIPEAVFVEVECPQGMFGCRNQDPVEGEERNQVGNGHQAVGPIRKRPNRRETGHRSVHAWPRRRNANPNGDGLIARGARFVPSWGRL